MEWAPYQSELVNTDRPRIPTRLRKAALRLSMGMRGEGMNHKKWDHIARVIGRRMGLTTPMSGSKVKGQVQSMVLSIRNKQAVAPLKNQGTIDNILQDKYPNKRPALHRGLRGFPTLYAHSLTSQAGKHSGHTHDNYEEAHDIHQVSDKVDNEYEAGHDHQDDQYEYDQDNEDEEMDMSAYQEMLDESSDDFLDRSFHDMTKNIDEECPEVQDEQDDIIDLTRMGDLADIIKTNPKAQRIYEQQLERLQQYGGKSKKRPSDKQQGKENKPPVGNGAINEVVRRGMTPEEVFNVLCKELGQTAKLQFITDEDIDGEAFYQLTDVHLTTFGLNFGQRSKIARLQNLRQQGLNLNFGPAAKACVSSAKGKLEGAVMTRVVENIAAREEKLRKKEAPEVRKTSVAEIDTVRIGARGGVYYIVIREDGKRANKTSEWMHQNHPEMKTQWDAEHPEFFAVPSQRNATENMTDESAGYATTTTSQDVPFARVSATPQSSRTGGTTLTPPSRNAASISNNNAAPIPARNATPIVPRNTAPILPRNTTPILPRNTAPILPRNTAPRKRTSILLDNAAHTQPSQHTTPEPPAPTLPSITLNVRSIDDLLN